MASPSPDTPATQPSVEATNPEGVLLRGSLLGAMQMTIYDYVAIGVLIALIPWGVARLKDILSGKRIERTEVGPDDELGRAVIERLSTLGLRRMPEVKRGTETTVSDRSR